MYQNPVTMHSPKTLTLLLAPDLPLALQLRWAVRLATVQKLFRVGRHLLSAANSRLF
jgi:hypothetical protein